MTLTARLKLGETLGDRVMKVDHAGEHGAICICRAQLALARWRAPEMVGELEEAGGWWPKLINPLVAASTETVIWLGMRL